ncbi:MAG: hypothetical protein LUC91_01250 [Prevotella sp.]|nr:hypothetical protein [Prevotella sp.]
METTKILEMLDKELKFWISMKVDILKRENELTEKFRKEITGKNPGVVLYIAERYIKDMQNKEKEFWQCKDKTDVIDTMIDKIEKEIAAQKKN